jgi:hypothetical protein
MCIENTCLRHQSPPRQSHISKTPAVVLCPPAIVAGKSVRAGGDFEECISGGGGAAARGRSTPALPSPTLTGYYRGTDQRRLRAVVCLAGVVRILRKTISSGKIRLQFLHFLRPHLQILNPGGGRLVPFSRVSCLGSSRCSCLSRCLRAPWHGPIASR